MKDNNVTVLIHIGPIAVFITGTILMVEKCMISVNKEHTHKNTTIKCAELDPFDYNFLMSEL